MPYGFGRQVFSKHLLRSTFLGSILSMINNTAAVSQRTEHWNKIQYIYKRILFWCRIVLIIEGKPGFHHQMIYSLCWFLKMYLGEDPAKVLNVIIFKFFFVSNRI